ncbi:MAG TPA: hypothetical protein VFZ09_51250 [Archangium sp.]|uniref:hypothetical protein n=1 Tax=Archangium sp. TaxID=1872627 RepID=UPI002E36CC19|nr:hypothetical protein [Archangium sp.]HEX5754665.1 hypothetical protein [Archangium sp.]
MKRNSMRRPLLSLLGGGLLAACGAAPEAGLASPDEPLGTGKAALCAGTSVTQLGGSRGPASLKG